MVGIESGYSDEKLQLHIGTPDKIDNSDGQNDVDNTTEFLSKFEGNQQQILKDCIQDIENDTQLKSGLDNLLKSGDGDNLINKIKQELEYGIKGGLDNETLKLLVHSIIAESTPNFKIGSSDIELSIYQADQKREEADQKREEADQKREEADQKREEEIEKGKNIDINKELRNTIKKRTQLLQDHPDIDEKTRKQAEIVKNQLPEETKNQLIEKGYDDNFINDYILLRVTLNEVKGNPDFKGKIDDFENSVNQLSNLDVFLKNIDNACNIADTRLSSFSKESISQTRTEMFNSDVGNNNLIEARDSNKSSHSDEYSELFKDADMMDTIKKYGKFFPEGAKQYLEKYEEYYKAGKAQEYENTEEGKKLMETLSNVKLSVDNYTQNFIEEMCLISQIKGMTMCIGEDFNLNKAREIKNDDGVLTLNGHLDGVDFSVRQDTNQPNARLQTSSKLNLSTDKSAYTVGKEEYSDSNFILPNQKEIFDMVSKKVVDSMGKDGALASAGNRNEFKEALENSVQSDIIGNVDEVYKNADLAHHYITDKVKGEKIISNVTSFIENVSPETRLSEPINETNNNKNLYPFIKILNFNIENSTANEKDKLNASIKKISDIIRDYRNGADDENFKYPAIIENFLRNEKWKKDGEGPSKIGLISDLFEYYSTKSKDAREKTENGSTSKMIINDLYRDLVESNEGKDQSPIASIWKDNKDADDALAKIENMSDDVSVVEIA